MKTLLTVIAFCLAGIVQAQTIPDCLYRADKATTYCTWYYQTPPPYTVCDGMHQPFNNLGYQLLPFATLNPFNNKTIWITQASVRIWGQQWLNGGFGGIQIRHANNPQSGDSELAITYDGLIQTTTRQPAPGVPFRPTDALILEGSCTAYPNPGPYSFPLMGGTNLRSYAFALWYEIPD